MTTEVKIEEIRGKDSRELRLDLQALRKERFDMTFRGAAEEIAKTGRYRQIRRTIARIMTVISDRDRTAGAGGAAADAPAKTAAGGATEMAPKQAAARKGADGKAASAGKSAAGKSSTGKASKGKASGKESKQ